MASSATFDFDRLLKPISDESPAGGDVRADGEQRDFFQRVKDATYAARDSERRTLQAEWTGDHDALETMETPDWRGAAQLACDLIADRSKDLWVASWLLESAVRLEGFAGLRDAFIVIRELCQRYWDGISPRPDEDEGYAHTVAQLTGAMDGALDGPIERIPITGAGSLAPLTGLDYAQAEQLAQMTDAAARQQRIDDGAVTLAMFDTAVRETSPDFMNNLFEDIQGCLSEFELMSALLDERCGQDEDGHSVAPPTSSVRAAIEAARDRVKGIAGHMLVTEQEAAETDGEGPAGAMIPHEGGTIMADGEVQAPQREMTRDDAFQVLQKVADYFEQNEPHSPVSYSLRQVVRWGRMSLPELLNELISDESVREELSRRTGVPPTNSDSN